MTTAENIPFQSLDVPDGSLPDLLYYLLENLIAEVGADAACVYTCNEDVQRVELVAAFPFDPGEGIGHIINHKFTADFTAIHLDAHVLSRSGFGSGLMWRMAQNDQTFGALVILSHSASIDIPPDHKRVHYCLAIARSLLQNQRLQEDEAISRTIREVAAHIGDSLSPQALVNLVSHHLLSPAVSFCGLLLYGPQQEDQPDGPFNYLEVQGTWSRQHGNGVGLGVRLYLEHYADLQAELDRRKVWHIQNIVEIAPRFDALIRAFIKGSRVHSAVMMALDAGSHGWVCW